MTTIDRRRFLEATAATLALGALAPRQLFAGHHEQAEKESSLVYVSPLRKDGAESTCHGEVWFVKDGNDLLVVTAADRWRAQAIAKGLDRARLWVGEHGVWKNSNGAFRSSPMHDATARIDADAHQKALEAFGSKYSKEWGKWGPRFKDGLADGSRVLIRYSPVAS